MAALNSLGRRDKPASPLATQVSLNSIPPDVHGGLSPHQLLSSADWSDPDSLILLLKERVDHPKTRLFDSSQIQKKLWCLDHFQTRVAKAPWRFRHPRVRSVHALLTMGGFDHVEAMSLCGTFNPNPFSKQKKFGYCSKRRFCQCCSWRDGDARVQKYLPAFNKNPGRIHAITISWKFPNGEVGLPFVAEREWDAQRLWDVTRDAARMLSSSKTFDGLLLVEQLACTHLFPLRVNPHNHGFQIADQVALPAIRDAFTEVIALLPEFIELDSVYGPLKPDIRFDELKRDVDAARWLNYCFTAFGLGRNGSCLSDVYANARSRCLRLADRIQLNHQLMALVDGVAHVCFDRNRTISLGRFSHRSKETLKTRVTKQSKGYVNVVYEKIADAEIYTKQDAPLEVEK